MRNDATGPDGSVAIPNGASEALLDRLDASRARVRTLAPRRPGVWAGRLALGFLLAGAGAIVVYAAAGNSILVPRSSAIYPAWEAGPLRMLLGRPALPRATMIVAYSVLLLIMTAAYLVALAAARSLSMRAIVVTIVGLNVILLLGPPLQLNDVFNYLAYARLGSLHGLNPYTHVINAEALDPVFRFSSWWNLSSPYGPLFTAITYPLAWFSLPVAYWLLKLAVIGAGFGFLGCVYLCAKRLGRDPRPVLLFVAANPLYVFYELGGFHNDLFMLLPSTAALAFLLARRDRAAGAALIVAVAVKLTAVILLPFLLIAARPAERRLRVLTGAVIATVLLAAMSIALFGLHAPAVAAQSGLVTPYSVPNLLGLLLGLGGSSDSLVRLLNVGVVVAVVAGLRRHDWIGAAGWATIALISSVAWLMPWYLVWALPLAALGSSPALRRTALIFTVFLVITFVPETGSFLAAHGIDAMQTPAGQAASTYQRHLQR